MKKIISFFVLSCMTFVFAYGQVIEKKEKKFNIGFTAVLPTGTWPNTALSNMGSTSFLKGQNHNIKSYGVGVSIERVINPHIVIFLDGNTYNYNISLLDAAGYGKTSWTVLMGATVGPNIGYAGGYGSYGPAPTEIHYDMTNTGFRLGAKYLFGTKDIKPWVATGFGYYVWLANYFNQKKDKTYGGDEGEDTSLIYKVGVDFNILDFKISTFVEAGQPIAKVKIDNLFFPGWNYEADSYTMGTYRIGFGLYF